MQCTIPANVHCQVGLYQVMNSEDIWESPRTFMPERFGDLFQADGFDERNEQMGLSREQALAFEPFGYGKRMCIGRKYADMAMKMVLISLLSRFYLVPCEMTENDIAVVYKTATMTPKNGVYGNPLFTPLFE